MASSLLASGCGTAQSKAYLIVASRLSRAPSGSAFRCVRPYGLPSLRSHGESHHSASSHLFSASTNARTTVWSATTGCAKTARRRSLLCRSTAPDINLKSEAAATCVVEASTSLSRGQSAAAPLSGTEAESASSAEFRSASGSGPQLPPFPGSASALPKAFEFGAEEGIYQWWADRDTRVVALRANACPLAAVPSPGLPWRRGAWPFPQPALCCACVVQVGEQRLLLPAA